MLRVSAVSWNSSYQQSPPISCEFVTKKFPFFPCAFFRGISNHLWLRLCRSRLFVAIFISQSTTNHYLIYIKSGAYDVRSMKTMTLAINGETRTIPAAGNIRELLGVLGIGESRVAVELNGKIIRRAEWEQMRLSDMDRVEIVQFVGGG